MSDQLQPSLSSPQQWWQYGVLGIGVVVFGLVIRFLFRQYQRQVSKAEGERKAMDLERSLWAQREQKLHDEAVLRDEKLRMEFEEKHNELLKQYAAEINRIHSQSREHEERQRAHYTSLIEKMSEEQRKAMGDVLLMLQKFHDRIVTERR